MALNSANQKTVQVDGESSSSKYDFSLVDHLLTLSYEERIDAHESACELVNDLSKAGQEYYARQLK